MSEEAVDLRGSSNNSSLASKSLLISDKEKIGHLLLLGDLEGDNGDDRGVFTTSDVMTRLTFLMN